MGIKSLMDLAVLLQFDHTSESPGGHSCYPSQLDLSSLEGPMAAEYKDKVLVFVEWLVTKKKEPG